MSLLRLFFPCWVVAILALSSSVCRAAETWADPALTVRDGLWLWLDASRADGKSATSHDEGERIAQWRDASGHKRHVAAPKEDARPIWRRSAEAAYVEFDGVDDHFRFEGPRQDLTDLTVFLVAAPRANPGFFRGLMALNAPNQRDYESGLTIDLGPSATAAFESLNIEGRGFGGARDVMDHRAPFGAWRILEAYVIPAAEQVVCFVDGKRSGQRELQPLGLRGDQITLGARFYENSAAPQRVQGFLSGGIAEMLIYDRVLRGGELGAVRAYLKEKYRKLQGQGALLIDTAPGLSSVANPPSVQMLAPGFDVRELPLDLPNINNVKYRSDGKLVAAAYNGDVYLLSDSDGDGLEDAAALFWESRGRLRSPIGMDLTPDGYERGQGLVVASKGKVSLIVDTDGDDRADEEIVLATGWEELPHGVDALGAAFDPRDGSVYFGLGAKDFTNAYLLDANRSAGYRLDSERGAILRIAPDLKSREMVCTGIRFPVALAFNEAGDLFCTDQEGATWLPNGNPLDELLHIQKGRHYGFPPRHPRHLPDVIDEPSTFDYSPQHQSTCGLNFNGMRDSAAFGPESWKGDAIVSGYSRGKLWRTQLAKTGEGYVARSQLLACLSHLTVDACASSQGDLVIATHSGGPDWGSGPTGKGKLFHVSYARRETPQPVAVWAASPQETHVALDRPIDPQKLSGAVEQIQIAFGPAVAAGDRFETLRPGYAVVAQQLLQPREAIAVHGVSLTPDRRTLILTTSPHRQAAPHALTLPSWDEPHSADGSRGAIRQFPQIDLAYDLCGVEAQWIGQDGQRWNGWLPHLDLSVSRRFLAGSAPHEALWEMMDSSPGTLTVRTKLDLVDMLRPAVQPGSQIDYAWPAESVTVEFSAAGSIELSSDAPKARIAQKSPSDVRITMAPAAGALLPIELTAHLPAKALPLQVAWTTAEDSRRRPLPLHRMILPWASRGQAETKPVLAHETPELAGANYLRGRDVFFSEQAACSKCHTIHGSGGRIGPDLSNLAHRDFASVRRDIVQPSFAINPDHLSQVVELVDGRVLTGVVRIEGDLIHLGDAKGDTTTVPVKEVEAMHPSLASIMPEGIDRALGESRMKDLLLFLLTPPLRMPDYGPTAPPPSRARRQVDAILVGATPSAEPTRPIRVVLVSGPKDHGPGEHDYPAWQAMWRSLMSLAENVTVDVASPWPDQATLQTADVLVVYQRGEWNAQRAADVDALLARGGGLVLLHYAVDGGDDPQGFARRIGMAWRGGESRFRHGPLDVRFNTMQGHPIARNFDRAAFHDESYWRLTGDPATAQILATGIEEGSPQPLFWTREQGKGRVFVSILGHYSWTFDDPLFRILLLRGIAWAAHEPVDRLNDLATVGARMAE